MRDRNRYYDTGSIERAATDGNGGLCLVPSCYRPDSQVAPSVALCIKHAGVVFEEMYSRTHGAIGPPRFDSSDFDAIESGRVEHHVVYYVRFADHIKIGTTVNLQQRLAAMHIHPDALLATEPGDRKVEAQRHHMFAASRYKRTELFTPTPELMEHIDHVHTLASV